MYSIKIYALIALNEVWIFVRSPGFLHALKCGLFVTPSSVCMQFLLHCRKQFLMIMVQVTWKRFLSTNLLILFIMICYYILKITWINGNLQAFYKCFLEHMRKSAYLRLPPYEPCACEIEELQFWSRIYLKINLFLKLIWRFDTPVLLSCCIHVMSREIKIEIFCAFGIDY